MRDPIAAARKEYERGRLANDGMESPSSVRRDERGRSVVGRNGFGRIPRDSRDSQDSNPGCAKTALLV